MVSNAISPTQRRSSRKAVMVAGACGIIAAVLAVAFLRGAKGGDSSGALLATTPVVVAARDIPAQTRITDGMVQIKQVSLDAKHALALAEKNRVVGQISRQAIAKDEQVLQPKVADTASDVGFSSKVPQGKRGVALAVTEVIATGGHISVHDFVDVIGVFETSTAPGTNVAASGQSDKPKGFIAATILQNVEVLAVAQIETSSLQSGGKVVDTRTKASDAKSVTLALTPEQAEKVFLAEEIGSLRLSLRTFGDDEQRKIATVQNDLPSIVGQ